MSVVESGQPYRVVGAINHWRKIQPSPYKHTPRPANATQGSRYTPAFVILSTRKLVPRTTD